MSTAVGGHLMSPEAMAEEVEATIESTVLQGSVRVEVFWIFFFSWELLPL